MNLYDAAPPPTRRHRKALAYIGETVEARGYPPTQRELADHLGLASPSSVHHMLQVMEARGYIKKESHGTRAITVLLPSTKTAADDQPAHLTDTERLTIRNQLLAIFERDDFTELIPRSNRKLLAGAITAFIGPTVARLINARVAVATHISVADAVHAFLDDDPDQEQEAAK